MFKTVPAKIKAAGTEEGLLDGQFRALVSVFNNRDAMGDVVVPGAFTKTLQQWRDSGDTIPVYWSHQMHDPDYNIGWVVEAEETADGLEVLATLDLEPGASSKAEQVYRLLKGRRVTQFSFAYDVLDAGAVEKDGQTVNELRELQLYEVGPTPIGANTSTELLAVKHLAAKSGRTLSAKNERTLTDAVTAITAGVESITTVLASVHDSAADDAAASGGKAPRQEQASATGPATTKEPDKATVKEPRRTTPVSVLAAHLSFLELEGDV